MSEFSVSLVLSDLTDIQQQSVVEFIKNDMGVTNDKYLSVITEEDFTQNGILTKVQARLLIKYWQTGIATYLIFLGEKSAFER